MKTFFLLTLFFFSIPTFSQVQRTDGLIEITKNLTGEFAYPKFSNDGTKIFFSTPNYKGIYQFDLVRNKLDRLTYDDGAGYEFIISNDNGTIFFRNNRFINNLKFSSLISLNLKTRKINVIESDKRELYPPILLKNGNIAYVLESKVFTLDRNLKKRLAKDGTQDVFVFLRDSKIVLLINGVERLLTPNGEGHYIWPSLSPDKTQLLFTHAGVGTFITDLNGKIISNLGYANYPRWSPDGNWVLYMNDKDDGKHLLSSDIWAISLADKRRIQLTDTKDQIEMFADWSPDGKKIVYNTNDGKIFLLNIENMLGVK